MGKDPTKRFSDRVEHYVKYRPDYPARLLDVLLERTGPGPSSEVADVGAGTGIFTALLLDRVKRVHAVEPNAEMRRAAEAALGRHHAFSSVAATAEETTLPDGSVELVTVAQAFHWLDPEKTRREFSRILKPGGWVALVWNERMTGGTPFLEAYDALLKSVAPEDERSRLTRIDTRTIGKFFQPGFHERIEMSNAQSLDREGLTGRALSSSYVPNPGHPDHEAFVAGLRELHERHASGGCVEILYRTRLYLGRLG